ncbi:MAG TPA: metallophosphoesterase [Thermoleophilia bacterium]|nr:metallophosphoesterase [Thermoleophilia bacterium]
MPRADRTGSRHSALHSTRHSALGSAARTAALSGTLAAGYMLFESQWLLARENSLHVPRLPPSLEGLSILHLSDVHAGQPGFNLRTLEKAVGWAVERRPDLAVLTGDILGDRSGRARCLALLGRLQPRLGIFAVPGNHEYGLSKNPLTHLPEPIPWESCGVRELRDSCVMIDVPALRSAEVDPSIAAAPGASGGPAARSASGPAATADESGGDPAATADGRPAAGAARVALCGADYLTGGAPLAHQSMPLEADLRLLLVHRPPTADDPLATMFDLAFSGHTHGGQIRIPTPWGLRSPHNDHVSHLEGVRAWGNGLLVVSAGIGTTFLPLRLFTRPQVVIHRLTSAPSHAAEARDAFQLRREADTGESPSGIYEDVGMAHDGGGATNASG